MVKIAVAGGSQGLGSALVQGLESHSSHECFILSRKAVDNDSRYLVADYSNIDELQNVLEANDVHTVISAVSMENGGGESQMNLIEAAERSKSTRRFMPSEFGMVHKEKYVCYYCYMVILANQRSKLTCSVSNFKTHRSPTFVHLEAESWRTSRQ